MMYKRILLTILVLCLVVGITVAAPTAEFTSNVTEGYPSFVVLFTNQSYTDITAWYWDFGDGETSTDENPEHTYDSGIGNSITSYDVKMNVTNTSGYTWENKTAYITAYPLNGSFSLNDTAGYSTVDILFTDLTDNGTATNWNWSFGDGEYSDTQSPTHTYDDVIGNTVTQYTVSLNASNLYSYDWENKTDVVTVYPLNSSFSANATSGDAPSWADILFTDLTDNGTATSWNWSFGDGEYSEDQNPVHSYTSADTYTVTLNASNAYSYDVVEKVDYITVTDAATTVASFSANVTEGYPALPVLFTDSSTNTTSWNWSFGDGEYSDTQSPTHTYDDVIGNSITQYTVNLTATGEFYTDSEEKTEYITLYPLNASFSANKTLGYPSSWNTFNFTDLSGNGTATGWYWDFGDGNTSSDQNPEHTYAENGVYNVSVNVSNSYSFDWENKTDYITVTDAPVPVAAFSADDTEGETPHTVTFTDSSTNTPTSWNWYYNIGSGWVLFNTTQNPVKTFSSVDTYSIKLTAINEYGSDSEEKSDYITVTEEAGVGVAWYDNNYRYRKSIFINGDDAWEDVVYDYPVEFFVYTGTGTDTNNTIYLNGKGNLAELRFTDTDNNLLTYTIVNTTNTFFVQIPEIINSSESSDTTEIYLYYGYSSVLPSISPQSLHTWDNGGAFWFGDGFEDETLNTTRWNISVNTISFDLPSPVNVTGCTWITGYDNFYTPYDSASMASQLQANWSIPNKTEIYFKSRIVTQSHFCYSYGLLRSCSCIPLQHGTTGFGFVGADNLISAYIGHGRYENAHNGTIHGLIRWPFENSYYMRYYTNEYRYIIEDNVFFKYDGPYYCVYESDRTDTWEQLPGGKESGIDRTRYFGINRYNENISLLVDGEYLYNSTSDDISKFALVAGTNTSTSILGQELYLSYVWARELLTPYPIVVEIGEEIRYDYNSEVINFDRSTYALDDDAVITTTVPDILWDTLTYTYAGYVYDSGDLTTPLESWSITSQNQQESVNIGTYGAGTYYAYLYMTDISSSTSYLVDYDTATVLNGFLLTGYTYDAPSGEIISSATLNATQSGNSYGNVSIETGYYEFEQFSTGASIALTGTKTGYQNHSETITPDGSTRIIKNISFVPTDQSEYWVYSTNGTAAGGFVYILPYNITATGANVTLYNGSWSSSQDIGPEGWYFFNGLANSSTYNFTAELTSYADIDDTITTGVGDFTRTDFALASGTHNLTVYILDPNTGGLMASNCTVTTNDGAGGIESQTTSNGTSIFTDMYGSYTVTIVCSGYTTATRSVYMDEDKYITVTMSTSSSSSTGGSTYYNAHEVKFVVQNHYGVGLADTTVTVTPTVSTMDSVTNWLYDLLGIPTTSTIDTTPLTGTTDSYGAIAFIMIKEVKYSICCVNEDEGVDETQYLYPKEDAYVIVVSSDSDFVQPTYGLSTVTLNLTNETINTSYATLSFSYYDPDGLTTNLSFWVMSHASPVSTCHQEYCDNPNSCGGSYTCSCDDGEDYYWGVTTIRNGQTYNTTRFIHYQKLVDLGIESAYYPYIAAAFIIVLAAVFSVISVRFGAVLIPIFCYLFYYMKWIELNASGLGLLAVLLVIGIIAYIRKQENKVGS